MKYLLLASLVLAGCGGPERLYRVPPPVVATAPAGGPPTTRCFESEIQYNAETGCEGWTGDSRVAVSVRNEMTSSFRWIGAAYVIDGVLAMDTNDPAIGGQRAHRVATAHMEPGHHELAVLVFLQGHGEGVFSYLSGYRFQARAVHAFEVQPGRPLDIEVIAEELDGPAVPLEKRPQVRFVQRPAG
ncbi:MAG: hypothetical protein HOV80_33510 [Polyangiaceae bacterium]|nr:hypothetical protein [Polyangiaceae bacterium]